MASGVAQCAECGRLKAVYEHYTVLRMQAEADSDLHALFGKFDAGGDPAVLSEMRGVLNRRRYIQNLVRDVDKALA